MPQSEDTWLFGYGSLIWRPDITFIERRLARAKGWTRRFWQGSHDHRGVPDAPGRVVTMIPERDSVCEGMAYRIEPAVMEETFTKLDHREKNGYERHDLELVFYDGTSVRGVVYVARRDNFAYLGPAPFEQMVEQIRVSQGPSGANSEYLLELAGAFREHGIEDTHVFELEARLRAAIARTNT